jgi:serine/threonine-protein kinase
VESSEFVPAGGRSFEPAVLARIEGALAECVGPLARVLVRKAVKTAPDAPALCQALAVAVPEAQQAMFRERLGDLAGQPATPPPGSAPRTVQAAPAAAGPGRPLSAAALAEATDRLAVNIGPMAKVLVKRAAEQVSGTRELYERLAHHIDAPADRRRFTAATEELSEP